MRQLLKIRFYILKKNKKEKIREMTVLKNTKTNFQVFLLKIKKFVKWLC